MDIKPAIGKAKINEEWKDVETIDESRLFSEGFVRVIWRDSLKRRNTSFVKPGNYYRF